MNVCKPFLVREDSTGLRRGGVGAQRQKLRWVSKNKEIATTEIQHTAGNAVTTTYHVLAPNL